VTSWRGIFVAPVSAILCLFSFSPTCAQVIPRSCQTVGLANGPRAALAPTDGRPLTITAAGTGSSTTFSYNAQTKQLASVTTTTPGPGGAPHTYTVSYVLSADGKRKSMSSSAGTVNYTWNSAGQITGLTDTLEQTTSWTFDHSGRPTTQTSTSRQGVPISTTYTYGPSGQAGDPSTAPVYLRQITQKVNGATVRQYTLKHSYLGQLLQRDGTWTNGRFESSTFSYDGRGRPSARGYSAPVMGQWTQQGSVAGVTTLGGGSPQDEPADAALLGRDQAAHNAGAIQTGGTDPTFTRWLPLSFSPSISSHPFRQSSRALPAPWGNIDCFYGRRNLQSLALGSEHPHGN
jgi:YD repeat-containing protein